MSVFEPWVGKRIGEFNPPKLPNLNRSQFKDANKETTTAAEPAKVTPQKPKQGPPQYKPVKLSEEPQMEQKAPEASKPGKLPVKHTRSYPKMNKKPTAPGTRPKKR